MVFPFRPRTRRIVCACIGAVLLGLCGSGCSQRDASAAGATDDASLRSADASQSDSITDTGKGADYRYAIRYPRLPERWAPLDAAIRTLAASLKNDTLDIDRDAAGKNEPPRTLDLKFDVVRQTSDFVSVLGTGSAYTGGAHGMPIQASFNLHLPDAKLVSIGDLFTDADVALDALSAECRRQLEARFESQLREQSSSMTARQLDAQIQMTRHWVERGTRPKTENFDVFLVDGVDSQAIGLTVIFPPYQVASYADGPQQVEVPAQVFYDLLKPEYRDAFAIDTGTASADRTR